MKFIDIIKSDKNVDYIIMMYDKKVSGLISGQDYYDCLNEHFELSWSNETWSRYTNVLYEVYNRFTVSNHERTINVEVQRHKNVQTRREIRHIARNRILEDYVAELLEGKHMTKYVRSEYVIEKDDEQVDVFVSDIHFKGDTQYIKKFGEDLTERVKGKQIVLHIVGDVVQGTLRLDDVYNGSIDVVQQAFEMCDALLESTKDVNIHGVVVYAGNHDELRLTNYKGSQNPSMAKVVARYLEKCLDCNVYFEKDSHTNMQMTVMHGHQFRGKKNMIAWGKEQDKMVVFGHYHSFGMDENVVMLPALCDSDEYAKSLNLSSKLGYVIIYNQSKVEFIELEK